MYVGRKYCFTWMVIRGEFVLFSNIYLVAFSTEFDSNGLFFGRPGPLGTSPLK